MTNYEEQFDAIIAEGRVFYLDPPFSKFFRYLFACTNDIGQYWEGGDSPVASYFRGVAYALKESDPEKYVEASLLDVSREVDYLSVLGGVVYTGPGEGVKWIPCILPAPEVLRMILETAEGRTDSGPYTALSVDDIRALRRGYRMADSYAEEMRTRREKTPSGL